MAYALPRVITEYMAAIFANEVKGDRMITVLGYLEQASQSEYVYDLLEVTAHFIEQVVSDMMKHNQREKAGLLLRNLIGLGKLNEDNQFHVYRKIFATLQRLAPTTWAFYESMTTEERERFKLVDRKLLPQELPVVDLPLKIRDRVVNTAKVQFSWDEITQIEDIRAYRELAFGSRAMEGSGWERELYVHTDLPWGFTLRDRTTALETYKTAIKTIDILEGRLRDGRIENQYTQALSTLKAKIAGFVRTADLS